MSKQVIFFENDDVLLIQKNGSKVVSKIETMVSHSSEGKAKVPVSLKTFSNINGRELSSSVGYRFNGGDRFYLQKIQFKPNKVKEQPTYFKTV